MSAPADDRLDIGFRVFTTCWSAAMMLGMLKEAMATSPLRIAVTVLAVVMLAFPGSVYAFGAFSLAFCAHYLLDTHAHDYTHLWFIFMVSCGALIALGATWDRDEDAWRRKAFAAFAPVGFGLAVFCFFMAGFAKLNSDFHDPATSCAAVFYRWQRTVFPFSLLPAAGWAEQAAVYTTFFTEILSPLLLLHPRTRKVGFFGCWILLLLLGTNNVGRLYAFASPFLALFVLGFDWSQLKVEVDWARTARWAVAAVIGLLFAYWMAVEGPKNLPRRYFARSLFVSFALLVPALMLWRATATKLLVDHRAGALPTRAVWAVMALMVVHESTPYLGLRAPRAFAMASGLVINTHYSNHLLIGPVPDMGFNSIAVVYSSDDPLWANSNGRNGRATYALYDYFADKPDSYIDWEVNGERERVDRVGDDPRFTHNIWARLIPVRMAPLVDKPRRCGKPNPPATSRR